MLKNTKIEVIWYDTVEESAWTDEKEIDSNLTECKTVGYFFKQTKQILTVSGTISGKTRNYTQIPAGCIKEIRVLYSRKKK